MQKRKYFVALILGLLVMASATTGAEVETTWHREAEPSRYSSFALVASGGPQGVSEALGPGAEAILRSEIERRLGKMGYVKSGRGKKADFRIQYDASAAQSYMSEVPQRELLPFNEDDWIVPQFEVLRESYLQGTLILTVRDGETDEPVWCGWSTESLDGRRLERKVKKLVRRILREYPSRGGARPTE